MITKPILLIVTLFILGIFFFLLFSGKFRAKKLECPPKCHHPTTPGEINKQVFNRFDPKGGYQPLHINMDNNEHYVIIAKAETKDSLITGLHFLLYNAKNAFFKIGHIKEPVKNGKTLDISIIVKRCSFFDAQVQSPVFVPLTNILLKDVDLIDIHLPSKPTNESSKFEVLASEVGGHICTSILMK